MVRNDVWKEAFPLYGLWKSVLGRMLREGVITEADKSLVLCLECLERRVGRPLQLSDFTSAPLSQGVFWGYYMGKAAARREMR
jgi:hypothetical protein